ncbi:probable disease resistance protein At1g15890 isoform X2 [Typha angustifolia]|uniref:probable disease resistance protein At1g15890 isoform X2 n=1 Tax=Typha angustifolia TaxID=59011 RepID=UPI003C2D1BB2
MDQIIGSITSILISPLTSLMNHIIVHATYPFKVGNNVKALLEASKDLEERMKDVNMQIETAERKGLTAKNQVQRWLEKVKGIVSEMQAIRETYNQRSCKCLSGYSLNCCSNYSVSKRAAKKLLDIQKLSAEGAFESIAEKLPPPLIPDMPTTSNASGRVDSNLKEALHYLNEDDTVTRIGIWGMGGVGKTHLLKQIQDSFYRGNSIFNVVILVTASKEYSVAMVQDEIFKKLGLAKSDDVQLNAETISNFLAHRSFLLLLDDLWGPLDLEAVGVRIALTAVGSYKRKVVLTTRSDEVCGAMRVERQIKVDKLDEIAAWSLFQKNVGEQTLNSDPYIATIAKEVIKELDGLPLALITIGSSMHAKKHYRAWERALEQLKESQLYEIEHRPNAKEITTFQTLKFSYESLESDTLRQCFLSCSMWPEDYAIPKEELILCWIGLGLVKVDKTLRSSYNYGYDLMDKLQAACLLEDSTSYESWGYVIESVKMHDVLRDMALWIARDYGENNNKWIVNVDVGQVENIGNEVERISVMNISCKRLSFPPLTKLTTLILRAYDLQESTVLVNIQALQALTFLDFQDNYLKEFPMEICKLVKLQYLNLSGNLIKSLPEELKSLTNLKFLHLRHNLIQTISKGAFSILNALKVLDLFSFDTIYSLPSLLEELKSLHNLRALGITVGGDSQFQLLEKSTNIPIQSLKICHLKEPALFLTANFLGNLNHFEISTSGTEEILIHTSGQNANSHLDLEILRFTMMEDLKMIVWKGVSPKDIFPKLRSLEFLSCNKIENVSWIVHLPCLQELFIDKCFNMMNVICCRENNHGENSVPEIQEDGGDALIPTFPCLQCMVLNALPKLHTICDPGVTFPSLRYLHVEGCEKLKKLPFQPHTIPSKLEKIEYWPRSLWEGLEWEEDSLRSSLEKI